MKPCNKCGCPIMWSKYSAGNIFHCHHCTPPTPNITKMIILVTDEGFVKLSDISKLIYQRNQEAAESRVVKFLTDNGIQEDFSIDNIKLRRDGWPVGSHEWRRESEYRKLIGCEFPSIETRMPPDSILTSDKSPISISRKEIEESKNAYRELMKSVEEREKKIKSDERRRKASERSLQKPRKIRRRK